ncbi:hypothetical protein LguiB_010406 [Lonicera macranthoides]
MQETDSHDLSDDADYAASMQQGSGSMSRCDSSKRSSSSEPDSAEIVYSKDNVAIHPTQYASERIAGKFRLIKQGSSLFMTWIPYKEHSNARLSERGLAYPPLYFYNGGVKELFAVMKNHVSLIRSAEDPNVYLVNDFQDPLQRTLSSLELPRAVPVANGPSSPVSAFGSPSKRDHERTDRSDFDGSLSVIRQNGRHRQKSLDPARDISIQVLEKFSLVTRFARETTSQLFRESQSDGFSATEKRNHGQSAHDHPSHMASGDVQEVPDLVAVDADPLEIDKLTLVWGKPRQLPLGPEEWDTFLDPEGRVLDSEALRKRIFYGGVEHGLRKEVWKFLLGSQTYDSTYAEREYLTSMKKSEYETIKNQWQSISREQAKRFTKFRERKGLIEKDVVRTDRSLSFYEGDDNPNVNLLRDILLTYSFYNFDLGYCQGMSDLLSPILFVMKNESESFWCFVSLMERLGPNFNRDQNGMHSQLFALMKLVELLDIPLHNYFKQNDCLNYFFCFRWVLIQFKRQVRQEFEYERTLRLWEVLWTHYLSEHFHLYLCVAILKRYRTKIMGEQMDFDSLLKFINGLSGQIDLDAVLRDAEALCLCAGENGAASIPPGTPPSLPVEDGSLYHQQEDDDDVL